jgi:hypothetical protein
MNPQANLKTIVRGAYDIQKLRIQMGGRVVANFKAKLGQAPGEKEETLDTDAKELLASLRAAYRKITDGVKTFPRQKEFKGDEVISSYTELCLLAQYVALETMERQHFAHLKAILNEYPIYTEFLEGVKGVGPAMAGVIISEIDITKDRYPSSIWRYAGLDVVGTWKLEDVGFVSGDREAAKLWVDEGNVPDSRPLVGNVDPDRVTFTQEGPALAVLFAELGFTVCGQYQWEDRGGRSRRKAHLVEYEYTNAKGEPATRVGVTFNPFLKTKLMGVLSGSFLKVKDSPYAKAYYEYKHRMENHTKYGIARDKDKDEKGHAVTSKGRRHNMALRYMVKRFLVDLYKAWRALEGLPVAPEYSEAKLGHTHSLAATG